MFSPNIVHGISDLVRLLETKKVRRGRVRVIHLKPFKAIKPVTTLIPTACHYDQSDTPGSDLIHALVAKDGNGTSRSVSRWVHIKLQCN
jgi:hypothetical protein